MDMMGIISGYGDQFGVTLLVNKGTTEQGIAMGHKFYPPDHPDFAWAVETLESLPQPTPVDPEILLGEEIRSQRNDLLTQSDWTQVADAPVDKAAWSEYRQALRGVPQQEGFPRQVVWPTPPTP